MRRSQQPFGGNKCTCRAFGVAARIWVTVQGIGEPIQAENASSGAMHTQSVIRLSGKRRRWGTTKISAVSRDNSEQSPEAPAAIRSRQCALHIQTNAHKLLEHFAVGRHFQIKYFAAARCLLKCVPQTVVSETQTANPSVTGVRLAVWWGKRQVPRRTATRWKP